MLSQGWLTDSRSSLCVCWLYLTTGVWTLQGFINCLESVVCSVQYVKQTEVILIYVMVVGTGQGSASSPSLAALAASPLAQTPPGPSPL